MLNEATKVVMIVDVVSPTPYALLRRAKNFEYRDDDSALQEFASYEDPTQALTDECQRVLKTVSSINQSSSLDNDSKTTTRTLDPSWSRFEDLGFGSTIEESDMEDQTGQFSTPTKQGNTTLRATPRSRTGDFGRPTTPSWADFLSSGFVDDGSNKSASPVLLPPDQILPPINTTIRGQSSQSHRKPPGMTSRLEPGELASINKIMIDDAFWWVWISSLAGEEPTSRKAAFGRCALIETVIQEGNWMVMEEQVKGAAPEPAAGAYIAEKKGFLGFTKRGRLTRRRSGVKKAPPTPEVRNADFNSTSMSNIAPSQQAKIHEAAAELTRRHQEPVPETNGVRRGRENMPESKTNSVMTLQPYIKDEASPALQWASQYDKTTMRAKYLGDEFAGKGSTEMQTLPPEGLGVKELTQPTESIDIYEQRLPTAPPKDELPVPAPAILEDASHSPEIPQHRSMEPATPPLEPEQSAVAPAPADTTQLALSNNDLRSSDPVEGADPTVLANENVRPSAGAPRPPSPTSKRLKKKQAGPPPVQKTSGIRRLFGTKRSKSRERSAPSSPVETNPAILAARRALEGKDQSGQELSSSPQSKQNQYNKLRNGKSPVAAVQTVTQPRQQPPRPARSATPPAEHHALPEPTMAPPPVPDDEHHGPPTSHRDEEYDQLSRVDTNEREHADREFSTFDQGPLIEQPAFAPPTESPSRSGFFTPLEEPSHKPQHQSVYSAVTMDTVTTDDGAQDGEELTPQLSPSDRWAQIRKNAADRAARVSEDQGSRNRTETRTDDGETSGEESELHCT